MGVNKVEYGSNTLVDLTGDTVTPEALLRGITAHNAAGNQIVGTGSGGGGGSMEDTEDLIKRTVGWVGKNLFAISQDHSETSLGVAKVIDREAGTVTLNGTAIANDNFSLWFDADKTHYTIKAYTLSELGWDLEKTYKIIVENASANCYFTISDYRSSRRYLEINDSDPVTFTFTELGVTSTTKLMCHVRIVQNATFNNTVIKPMITESQYTDEFEPNHPPATEYFPRFIVCETEAEWDALSQAEKDDPNIYWVRPWADTVAFATDKTPVGTVLSVATGKTGDGISGITTPTGTFPTADYLVCDGQSVPVATYPALVTYFQTRYGSAYYFGGSGASFSLPNWSSDFPSNGILVMKARESSNAMSITEIDDTSVSTDKTWSSEKIDSEIDALNSDLSNKILSNGGNPLKFKIFTKSITFNNGDATVSGSELAGVTAIGGAFAQCVEGNFVSIIRTNVYGGANLTLRAMVLNTSPANPYSGTIGVNLYVLYS